MHKLTISSPSRWKGIRNALCFGGRAMQKNVRSHKRRSVSFESLEERSLLSVCHWTGGADNRWSNPENWDSAPQAGDALVFQGTGIATQNDLPQRTTFSSIEFASKGFTLTGNTIWVNDSITVDSGVSDAVISLGVALGGAVNIDVTDATSSLTVSGILSNGGSVTKVGAGMLTLNGANTYTGGTTINDGTLELGNNSALGAANSVINVNGDNASLNLNGYCSTVGQVILADGSIVNGGGAATLTGSDYIVMKGAITASLAGNGELTKITEDLVTLSGNNSYSGLTTVRAGELRMVGSDAWKVVFDEAGTNVQGGKLSFDYTNDSNPASSIQSILDASYGDGSSPFAVGNGAKIYSSTANDACMALGWTDDGVSKVTVMYTWYGDATLDGAVNSGDFTMLLQSYGGTGKAWAQGDFNYDGVVNSIDVSILSQNFRKSLARPSLALSGANGIDDNSTYTLTLGEVTGVAVQSYVIDWGDGASPSIYTAAQIQALNGQVTHTYATGSISPTIIVDLIDNKGVTYSAVAGKHVAAGTTAAHVSSAPVISNFYCINDVEDCWTLSGTATDTDDPVQGDVVTFGGVLASYNLTATVGADGVFSISVELDGLQEGTGTAQTTDPHGVLSNVAGCWVIT